MILKSFEELGAVLPCPVSPDASALVREADDLLEALGAMVHAAREVRQRAAGQAETAATLADKAQAIEAQLAQAQGLTAFGVDEAVVQALAAQAAGMRHLAQELRDDPAVRAYQDEAAAAEAAHEQAAAATRQRLRQALAEARDLARQGDHEKATALIGEIRAVASNGGLAVEFDGPTAELAAIVAQAQETVKIREAEKRERETRRAFGRWLDQVRQQADWSQGDVVVTLGLGQARHLRPRTTRRAHVVWDEVSSVGVAPKDALSTLPRRACLWDWRGQAPGAARTLEEAARRAGTAWRPRRQAVAEEPAPYAVPSPPSVQEPDTPAGTGEAAAAGDPAPASPTGTREVAPNPAPTGTAAPAADALASTSASARTGEFPTPRAPVADGDVDALVQALVRELGAADDEGDEGAASPADADEGPVLVVFEAETPALARQWSETVAGLLQELGCDVLAATVEPGTPHIGVWGLVIADDEALAVDVTVGERLWPIPVSLSATSRVKTPARRTRNVAASLARQLARHQPAPAATP